MKVSCCKRLQDTLSSEAADWQALLGRFAVRFASSFSHWGRLAHLLKAVHTGQEQPVRIVRAVACHLLLAMRGFSPMLHCATLPHTICGIIVLPGIGRGACAPHPSPPGSLLQPPHSTQSSSGGSTSPAHAPRWHQCRCFVPGNWSCLLSSEAAHGTQLRFKAWQHKHAQVQALISSAVLFVPCCGKRLSAYPWAGGMLLPTVHTLGSPRCFQDELLMGP